MRALALAVFSTITLLIPDARFAQETAPREQAFDSTRRVHISRPKPGEGRYAYVPFDVPAGARRITVSYNYDRADGANALDLGLFDARSNGRDDDARGFRGWSGGRRAAVFVARDEATPGYVPGEMPAGTWRVILGLYRVAPAGVDVALTFRIETDADEQTNSPAAQSPARMPRANSPDTRPPADAPGQISLAASPPRPRWLRGDLHAHTVHSDGDWTVLELARAARAAGLDFLSVTDHNTTSHHADIARSAESGAGVLLLRGEEVTTYGGHVNAWGLPDGALIDFRVTPGNRARMSRTVGEIRRLGALASVNHPFALCGGCDWGYDRELRGFDSVEVWNGAWDFTDERALALWDTLLQKGRRITAVGSSDSHRASGALGQPTTHVAARSLTERELLEGIRRGRVYVTRVAASLSLNFAAVPASDKSGRRSNVGDELVLDRPGALRFVLSVRGVPEGAAALLISDGINRHVFQSLADGGEQAVELDCATNSYFRVEVRDRAGAMLAFTNPIHVTIKNPPRSPRRTTRRKLHTALDPLESSQSVYRRRLPRRSARGERPPAGARTAAARCFIRREFRLVGGRRSRPRNRGPLAGRVVGA